MTMSSQDEGYRGGRAGDSDHHVTSRGSGPGAGRHSAHHHHGNNGKSRTKDSSTEPRDPQSVRSWSCTSFPRAAFSRPDQPALLPFQDKIETTSENVTYEIYSPSQLKLLIIDYFDSPQSGQISWRNCTFVGQIDTGLLTIRLETTYKPSGVYRLDKNSSGITTTPQCLTVFLLGVPSKPSISSDRNPYVGGAVTLTCSSVSTTTPSNHNLSFVYNWIVDDVENPAEARYTYSSDRINLKMSNVLKGDTTKQFKCTATENVTDGYTSATSNSFSITLDLQSWSCTNISRGVFSRPDKQTLLLFQAEIESSNTVVNYKIFSPDEFNLLTVAYFNNQQFGQLVTRYCTFVGQVDTGQLTIRLETTYNPSGVYRIDKILNGINTTPQCFTVFVLGVPSTPKISADNDPIVGGTVTLTCSSVSTTTPSNHNLSFVYNWIVDDLENPSEARYTYSSDRRNLKMSNVLKGDTTKQFKCTATENVTDGYTSANSNTFSITVLGVLSTPSISKDKTPHVGGSVMLTCSSVLTTTYINNTKRLLYNWIVDDVENPSEARYSYTIDRRNLTVSNVLKEDSKKTFKCSATINVTGGYTSASSSTFLLTVIYGPDRVEVNVPETYIVTEGQPVGNITCTADCYPGCSYRWMNNSVPVGSDGVLNIGTARRYHAGNYTCSARNTAPEFGKSSEQSTTIIVTCNPLPPKNFRLSVFKNVLLFTWEGQSNCELEQSFLIQTAKESIEHWDNQTLIHESDEEHKTNQGHYFTILPDLPEGVYRCRIIAVSSLGSTEAVYLPRSIEINQSDLCEEMKTSVDSSALIIGVVLGTFVIGLVVLVAVLVVKLRRLLDLRGRDGSGKSASPMERQPYTNLAFDRETDTKDQQSHQQNADNQYVTLDNRARDDARQYDVLNAEN